MSAEDTLRRHFGLLRSDAVWTLRRLLLGTLALLVVAILLPSPSHAARRNLKYRLPTDAIESLQFEVQHTVTTRFDTLPPEAEPYDVKALEASLAEVKTSLSGRIERVVGRVFRDSSLGLVSRIIDLEGTIDRGEGAVPVNWSGLEGKSVSMRMLESGELLASAGWQHIAGAARGGDAVYAVLLQSILRLPFDVPAQGGAVPLTFRSRVPVDPLLNLDRGWNLSFTAGEPPAGCGRRCVALNYEGTVTEAAVDQHPARPMKRDSTATVSGTVVLGNRAGFVKDHSFEIRWTHAVESLRENGTTRAAIVQEQVTTGRIFEDIK